MRALSPSQAVAELRGLERVLERLTYVPRRVAIIAAPKLTGLMRAQFQAGNDPYGRPWRGLKASTIAKGRRNPPLTADTKRLRDGTKAAPRPGGRAGIALKVGTRYGRFHQVGFRVGRTRVDPRRILPQFGMPLGWSRALEESVKQALREARR